MGENGEVRINAQNVTFHADNIMKLEGKKVQVEATDEFSLQAPFAHSSGHRGNLVPLSFLDVATSGQFVGADIISKFKTEGVAKLAGLSEKLYNKIIKQIIKDLPHLDEWHNKEILKYFGSNGNSVNRWSIYLEIFFALLGRQAQTVGAT